MLIMKKGIQLNNQYIFEKAIHLFSKGEVQKFITIFNKKKFPINLTKESDGEFDNAAGAGFMHFAVGLIQDEGQYRLFVDFFAQHGGDFTIKNSAGVTARDLCLHGDYREGTHYKLSILQEVAKGHHLMVPLPSRAAAHDAILPGLTSPDGELCPLVDLPVQNNVLQDVEDYISNQGEQASVASASDTIELVLMLQAMKPSIGLLTEGDEPISTVFLIQPDWIITARHALNLRELEDLSVRFPQTGNVAVKGVIEDGALHQLDYIILKLSIPIHSRRILELTDDSMSTHLVFVGYDQNTRLKFSASSNESPGQLATVSYHQTGITFSGTPYFGLPVVPNRLINQNDWKVCALHTKSSTHEKTGLYTQHIINTYLDSVLQQLIQKKDVPQTPVLPVEFFPEFTTVLSELGEVDEGDKPLKISVEMRDGVAFFSAEGRPRNQSALAVQKKIAERLRRLETAGEELTKVQETFLGRDATDYDLQRYNIHIAHNIAISKMTETLIAKMNTPLASKAAILGEATATQEFADAIASSDDENAPEKTARVKQKLPGLVKKIRDGQKKGMNLAAAENLASEAKKVLTVLNRRSKNLMPGHGSPNSAIGDYRDPHLVKNGQGYKETALSSLLSVTANSFFGESYEAKKNGQQIQSSSVDSDNDPEQSYCNL